MEIYSTLCFTQVTSLHGHMRFSRKSSRLKLSSAGSNKKIIEMNVYKIFLVMVACIFVDGKCMIESKNMM